MDLLKECLPEFRYLLTLSKPQSQKYLTKASPKLIKCLYHVALNIVYGGKDTNGLDIRPEHVKPLKKHRQNLLRLVNTKKTSLQRRLLKRGGAAVALLTVLATVIGTLAALV